MEYNEIFKSRTKNLALEIIRVFSTLKYSDEISIIRKQVIRSSTSVAANYRALCRSRSEKEKFAKLSIVIEEIDETLFWLEIIEELNAISSETLLKLKTESEEILKATASYRKRLKN